MKALSYKTKSVRKEDVQRNWYIVDAENVVLGRMASKIALILQGKNKPSYTPHVDTGDYVVVVNADKIRLTGNKMDQREYKWYTGYPGGQRSTTPRKLIEKKPTAVVEKAIVGMLPRTKLGRAMSKKLFIYAGPEHKHSAQQPQKLEF
ncbi:MAG: 50S ribosomal protein L13 [Saprospiraceae bacterium]|nr:50S ribosomal protein L13 [Saprospiraceae bacterium]